ncbi:TonB-dependent receptor plug domain protein [Porphyromonas sp. KLE 1280]|uniref:SusC/RagA family TonB-linked outer membrane protein n=1 Tax=Porphyromonas sp. KLE 1280 TaxID=997829 RepID=UPI0004DB063F|nr:SusC/RagA family TonB-linked outer membrane protein [Porphyromonas sp. KLE 1280]KDU79006.1 TonB-dependent receptor plug domain protein [Porphyromonas sp. KLE 1280]
MLLAGGWFLSSIVTAQAASPSLATSSGGYATQQNPTSSLNVFSGTVYDENGDPMPLVTVQILGQTGGFITDSKGHFEFKTKNATERVRVTFMGYKAKAVTLRGGTPLRIDLEPDNQTIESVVVTGFTKKDKKSYTGAQTTIKSEQLLSVGTKNLLQGLEAFVPGLQVVQQNNLGSDPNARPELNLRGRATFSGAANLPLFVVDGAIVDVEYIYDMDMNTIESVTVLKDASASALYGAKAAAGVIVITTKPISEGAIRVNYSGTLRLSMPDLSDYHLLTPQQKLQYEDLAGLYKAGGAAMATSFDTQNSLDLIRDRVVRMIQSGTNTDWLAKPLRTGVSHSHTVSADGGDKYVRYGLSLRYGNETGVMMQSARERLSGTFKLSYNRQGKFFASNTLTVNRSTSQDPSYGSFSNFSKQNPYQSPYDANGELLAKLEHNLDNPLYEASLGSFNRAGSMDFLNTTTAQYWIDRNLRIDGDFSFTTRNNYSRSFKSPLSYTFRNESDLTKKGSMTENLGRGLSFLGKLMVSYNRTFFEKLYVTSMAGSSLESTTADNSSYTSLGFYSDVLGHPNFALGYGGSARPSGSESLATAAGFFFNGNAIYDNRYSVDVVYRYEGSSKFGKNQRFAPFWSLGTAWNIHNEKFFEGNKNIQLLKLRASIGYLGNISFDPYQALTTYTYNNRINYIVGAGSVPLAIGNPELKWERTLSKNVGLDLTLFKNRWDLTFDAYQKTTDNLLLDVSLAPSIGAVTARQNVGEVENNGIEFQTRVVPIQTKDLQWSLSLNYSYNRNKVKKVSDALKALNQKNLGVDSLNRGTTPLPLYEEGESLTALKVVPSAGIDPATGKEIFIKRDGSYTFTYDPNDRRVFGDTSPWAYGSLTSYLMYKGFSLNANFGYSLGATVYNATLASRVEGTTPKQNADRRVLESRWKQAGDVTRYRDIASTESPYQTSRFIQKEYYFTLRSLSLAYETEATWVKKLHMRRARVELLANDLFYLSTVKRERGLDYPFARSVEMSLRLSF